jgi:hypothetical protein
MSLVSSTEWRECLPGEVSHSYHSGPVGSSISTSHWASLQRQQQHLIGPVNSRQAAAAGARHAGPVR